MVLFLENVLGRCNMNVSIKNTNLIVKHQYHSIKEAVDVDDYFDYINSSGVSEE